MSEHEDFYTPEQIDTQVEALLQARDMPACDQHMAHILRTVLANADEQADALSLQRVLHQLLETERSAHQQSEKNIPFSRLVQQQKQGKLMLMKGTREKSRKLRPIMRAFATLAAILVVAVLVGSMLIISHLAYQNKNSSIVTAHRALAYPHQGIYASSKESVFRLDSQTHRALWQQSLKDVAKILPIGNVVYILQSSQSPGGTNAVLQLDARNGKILWRHTFTMQTQSKNVLAGQTTDLAFFQGRLYVGWETWIDLSSTEGKVYVLNASDGRQKAVYANASVWLLAVSNDILAISSDDRLQVYDPDNGRPLWYVSLPGSSSTTVVSLNIVNGLLYTVLSNSTEISGAGQSFIVAYQATTGKQVWKSPAFPGDALSHFTVDQNIVYFGTLTMKGPNQPFTGRIYAYNTKDNKQLWSTPVNGGAQGPLVVSNGVVYTVVDNGSSIHALLVSLDVTTGKIKWQEQLAETFHNSFCVSNGAIYVSSFGLTQGSSVPEKIEVLNAHNGQLLWEDTQHGFNNLVPTE